MLVNPLYTSPRRLVSLGEPIRANAYWHALGDSLEVYSQSSHPLLFVMAGELVMPHWHEVTDPNALPAVGIAPVDDLTAARLLTLKTKLDGVSAGTSSSISDD